MSIKQIHILNGESTEKYLSKAKLKLDTLVWQEIFSEGPKSYFFNRPFLEQRKAFIAEFFDCTIESFAMKYNNFFNRMELLHNYKEVVLWFEEDLFCVWNMMACISYLHQYYPSKTISLVCPGNLMDTGDKNLIHLFSPNELETLFQNRITLNEEAILIADQFWKAVSENYQDTVTAFADKMVDPFPFLAESMQLEKDRFQDLLGLSKLDYRILKMIQKDKYNYNSFVSKFLKEFNVYGYGDAQYFSYLNQLKEYYIEMNNGDLVLNPLGEEAIKNA
ncbi:MAG: DUF1835 domain-containing protein [Bacteroidota bacterium]